MASSASDLAQAITATCATPLHLYSGPLLLRGLHHDQVADIDLLNGERHETHRHLIPDLDHHDLAERARGEAAIVLAVQVLGLAGIRVAAPHDEHPVADLEPGPLALIDEHDLALADQLVALQHRDDRALRVLLGRDRRH